MARVLIARVLGAATEENVVADPRGFILPDGRLDFAMLLREFAEFWREHGEVLATDVVYHEVAPQVVLMGYLHRVVRTPVRSLLPSDRFAIRRVPTRDPPAPPGGGYIGREYGVGRGRIDVLVRWYLVPPPASTPRQTTTASPGNAADEALAAGELTTGEEMATIMRRERGGA